MFADAKSKEANLKSTHEAVQILQAISSITNEEEKKILNKMTARLIRLLPSSVDTQMSDSRLVYGLVQANKNLKLKPKQFKSIVMDLVALKYTASARKALEVYRAFSSLSELSGSPLVLSFIETSLPFQPSGSELKVLLSDVISKPFDSGYDVFLTNLQSDEGDTSQQRKQFKFGNGYHSLTLALEPASYLLDLEAVGKGGEKVKFRKRVVVNISVSLTNIVANISPSRYASEGEDFEDNFAPGAHASSFQNQWLHLSFEVRDSQNKPFTPHQAFIRLTHIDSNLDTYFITLPNDKGRLSGAISLVDESSTLLYRSGLYSVSLQVGDSVISQAREASVGHVTLTLLPETKKEFPLYTRALLYDSDTTLKPLEEKNHTFRMPDKRAHTIVSLLFTVVVFGTLAALVVALKKAGANTKTLSSLSGTGPIIAIAFHSCIATILLLFVVYWLKLTMVTCLTYLAPLSLITLFIGNRTLCCIAAARQHTKQE